MLNARTQQRRTSDLETRITNRKQEMIAEIVEHKKNSSRAGAADEVDKIKTRLTELAQIVKEGLADGWDNVSANAKHKLEDWVSR